MTATECKTVSRCTGHCCQRFWLNVDVLTDPEVKPQDGDQIRDMLIFLEWEGDEGGWFTCRHFDAQTNNCQIYDRRPGMCRDYPYGEKCNYRGCTYKPNNNKEKEK